MGLPSGLGRRLHAGAAHDGCGGGGCQEADQVARRVRALGAGGHACGEEDALLHFIGQGADEFQLLERQQFADLLEADVRIATQHHGAHSLAEDAGGLALHLLGHAQAREQFVGQVGAAGAGRVGNGFGVQQGLPERVHGSDVGLGRALAHAHSDHGARQVHAAARFHLALRCQVVQGRVGEDDHVELLAPRQPAGNGVLRIAHGGATRGDDLVARGLLVQGYQLVIGGREAARGDHADFICGGGGGRGSAQGQAQAEGPAQQRAQGAAAQGGWHGGLQGGGTDGGHGLSPGFLWLGNG